MAETADPGSEAFRIGSAERRPRADPVTMKSLQDFLSVSRDLPFTPVRMRYLIFSQVRTGGTYLCEALQRSGHGGMPFEYLNPAAVKILSRRLAAGKIVHLKALMEELEKRRTGANGVFGIQLHLEQLSTPLKDMEKVKAWLKRYDRIVFLYRRDKLAQAVSLERSFQSSVWHRPAGETEDRGPAEWTIDPWIIARHLANLGQQERLMRVALDGMSQPVVELTYEELDTDFDGSWRRVSEFLGIPPMPSSAVRPQLARMRDAASEEMMARFLAALRDSDLMRDPAFATLAASRKHAR